MALSVTLGPLPPSSGGKLSGAVTSDGEDLHDYAVWPFLWTASSNTDDWPIGWKPVTSSPFPLSGDGLWYVHVAPAAQYAVLVVIPDLGQSFDQEQLLAPGTLPTGADIYVTSMSAERGVEFLDIPNVTLAGVVTGYGSAVYHPDNLGPGWQDRPTAFLRVDVWSSTGGTTKWLDTTRCKPSGYWSFDLTATEGIDEFTVAVTVDQFQAGDTPPREASGGVMAVATYPRRPPLTRGAGAP